MAIEVYNKALQHIGTGTIKGVVFFCEVCVILGARCDSVSEAAQTFEANVYSTRVSMEVSV